MGNRPLSKFWNASVFWALAVKAVAKVNRQINVFMASELRRILILNRFCVKKIKILIEQREGADPQKQTPMNSDESRADREQAKETL
jgi:hypothetical protein